MFIFDLFEHEYIYKIKHLFVAKTWPDFGKSSIIIQPDVMDIIQNYKHVSYPMGFIYLYMYMYIYINFYYR